MKRFRKGVALLVVVALVVFTAAGCGGGTGANEQGIDTEQVVIEGYDTGTVTILEEEGFRASFEGYSEDEDGVLELLFSLENEGTEAIELTIENVICDGVAVCGDFLTQADAGAKSNGAATMVLDVWFARTLDMISEEGPYEISFDLAVYRDHYGEGANAKPVAKQAVLLYPEGKDAAKDAYADTSIMDKVLEKDSISLYLAGMVSDGLDNELCFYVTNDSDAAICLQGSDFYVNVEGIELYYDGSLAIAPGVGGILSLVWDAEQDEIDPEKALDEIRFKLHVCKTDSIRNLYFDDTESNAELWEEQILLKKVIVEEEYEDEEWDPWHEVPEDIDIGDYGYFNEAADLAAFESIPFEEQVILDEGGCRVTATGIDPENPAGYAIRLKLENDTDRDLFFGVTRKMANGVWFEPDVLETLGSGDTREALVSFPAELIPVLGDDGITDIELSVLLEDYSSGEQEIIAEGAAHLYPAGKEAQTVYERTPGPDDQVVFEGEGITLTYIGNAVSERQGPALLFVAENQTEKDINVLPDPDAEVDGFTIAVDQMNSMGNVGAGTHGLFSIYLDGDDVRHSFPEGLDSAETLTLWVQVDEDQEEYDPTVDPKTFGREEITIRLGGKGEK